MPKGAIFEGFFIKQIGIYLTVSLLKINVLFEKRTKNFLEVLRGKELRKLCRVYTTHNDFFCILTGAEKIYNLLFN